MNEQQWQHLSAESLTEHWQQWQLVDIRDAKAFQQGHIPGAINLNNENFQNYLDNHDSTKQTVVICYHGNSSQGAATVLCNAGFEQVFSLDGGITSWAKQYPEFMETS